MANPPKDHRNIKLTQYDRGQVIKASFSELTSALKTTPVNGILKDAYTHIIPTYDDDGRLINVKYYQATLPCINDLTVVGDSSGSLSGQYIKVYEPVTQKELIFYFVVSGRGAAPRVSNYEYPVEILENDVAAVVAIALKSAMEAVEGFAVVRNSALSPTLTITFLYFGECDTIELGATGFTLTHVQNGSSTLVGEVDLQYNADGNIVYNGIELPNLDFNPTTASFEVGTMKVVPPTEAEGGTVVKISSNEEFEEMLCLLKDILIEMRIQNTYNMIMTDEQLTGDDIE